MQVSGSLLAVASSVAFQHNFDNLQALSYAIENDFGSFQTYIDQRVISDPSLALQIAVTAKSHGIGLIAHAPGVLNEAIATDPAINAAIQAVLQFEQQRLVVYHHDEDISDDDALQAFTYLNGLGFTVCYENYFKPGGVEATSSFPSYLALVSKAKTAGIDLIPVFDIPRLYDEQLNLPAETALALIDDAFRMFRQLGTQVILHLIDGQVVSQRDQWCPIGQGKIPYSSIFNRVLEQRIPIGLVVLEYEDQVSPLASRTFLDNHLLRALSSSHSRSKNRIKKVFISSTQQDLSTHRERVIRVCLELGLFPIAMENFPAMGVGATEASKSRLREADVYVGIFAHRYGYIEPGYDKSVTEIEFDYAGQLNLERLCFVIDPDALVHQNSLDIENHGRLLSFKERINKLVVRAKFRTPDDLATHVMAALVAWMKNKPDSTFYNTKPPAPRSFIGRDRTISDLKSKLTGGNSPVVAIHGWPGVGKSTVAAAMANDPEVSRMFPSGVFWASVGQQPDIFSKLSNWAQALDVEAISRARTPKDASDLLRGAFYDKQALLIIDDVWERKDVLPFMVAGPDCATLLTTRFFDVASELASPGKVLKLDVLDSGSALELLAQYTPQLVHAQTEQARELVEDLECLPLSLHIAGHLLSMEANMDWGLNDLLTDLRAGNAVLLGKAPPNLIEGNGTGNTVTALLEKSIQYLEPETRRRFAELSIVAPKPATFNLTMMRSLWQVTDPKPTVRTLVNYGLIEPVGQEHFQMHALLVSYADWLLEQDEHKEQPAT